MRKRSGILAGVVLAVMFGGAPPALAAAVDVASPDGRIVVHFETLENDSAADVGQITYSATFNKAPIMGKSALGLQLKDQPPLGARTKIVSSDVSLANPDLEYHLLAGKASTIKDRYNDLTLTLAEPDAPNRRFTLAVRVYDDAIAFRYIVPKRPGMERYVLSQEMTQFNLATDATAYCLLLPNYKSQYESEFVPLPVSSLCNQGGVHSDLLIGCPCPIHLVTSGGSVWLNIGEAELRGNAAMYLTNPSTEWGGHVFESRLAPHEDDATIAVDAALPHASAWRVIQVASSPGGLIESNVLTSLNPDTKIADTSWIKPGKASWNWWGGSIGADGKGAYTTEVMKYYVDFSAKNGLEYMLIDAGWAKNIDRATRHSDITQMNGSVDVPAVVAYAKSKGVKVWIWLSYIDAAAQMKEAFPLFEKWGVAGCKIDFVERNDQAGIQWYYDVAELAAQHHLMLDFHGCMTPTGMEREYPNIMGYEAVLGMEQSKAGLRDNPGHHVMLPFTRMLAGPMDYTPGSFHNVTREKFEPVMDRPMTIGTRAHQLAMYPIYFAPIQMVSDNPQAYEGTKEFEFIKECPTAWDETRAIDGYPGEFVVLARRKGAEWFLGAMTNDAARKVQIPLGFLGKGKFTAEIYADAADADREPTHVQISKQAVTSADTLSAALAPAGGYAVRFVPEK